MPYQDNKKILFIVHNYNNFQKDQIECVSSYFKEVYVLIRFNPIFRFINYLSREKFKKYNKAYSIDLTGIPNNIKIYETPVIYLPFGIFYKLLGKWHLNSALRIINKYKLEFDLIHGHFIWSSGYVATRLGQIYSKPSIVTAHGYDVYSLPFKSFAWKNKIIEILDRASAITTPSKSNFSIIKKLTKNNNVGVVSNG